jgi:cytochrome P450
MILENYQVSVQSTVRSIAELRTSVILVQCRPIKDTNNMSKEMPNRPSRNILYGELGASIESRVAWYHHMQETQPVRYRPEYDLWEVFRYEDVQQVLSDYATFASDKKRLESLPFVLGPSDPPQHRQLRGPVSKAFTPRRIEAQTPRLMQIVDELLESAIARGKMNVATELAYPLPMRVIAEMLGLPPEDQERSLQWSYQLVRQMIGIANLDNSELLHYFSELLNERKRDPRDDLISELLAAQENEACLTDEQIISICLEILTGGNITTATLLNRTIYRLCQHPEIYQALRYDSALIPGAIEEMLRYEISEFSQWRTARHDTVLGGHQIKADQYVVAWISAANFDETHFPEALQFDIRRSPNPHLTFSHGVHVCLGAPLIRLEGRIALERMVAHFSEIRLDPENPVQFTDQVGSLNIMRSLDILCTPAGSPAL